MVDHTSLIWSGRNLCRFIVRAWLTVPGTSGHKTDIFGIQSTCMEISVSLLCFFVHKSPYQTMVGVAMMFF